MMGSISCSEDSEGLAKPARGIQVHTPELRIEPYSEVFVCTYTDVVTTDDMYVTLIEGRQSGGKTGHHVAVYRSSIKYDPTSHVCADFDMAAPWLMFVGGAGGGSGDVPAAVTRLPKDVAILVPRGSQIMLQSHYINPGSDAALQTDTVNLHTVDPTPALSSAAPWAINESSFQIQPGKTHRSEATCSAERTSSIITVLGHTHQWGVNFELWLTQQGEERLIYKQVGAGAQLQRDPPIMNFPVDAPLRVEKGDRFRMVCEFDNTTDHILQFPEEMCVTLMYHYPAEGFQICD
ncbi:MAG: hypothetical protein HYT87_01590 [Nitrospirae bacterium]|nr:hypothetical protein [Nitrospirota bacterium]